MNSIKTTVLGVAGTGASVVLGNVSEFAQTAAAFATAAFMIVQTVRAVRGKLDRKDRK